MSAPAADGLADASRGGDVGAESHVTILRAWRESGPRSSRRRRACASPPAPPAACTWAARGRPCSTGCWRGTPAASSCCAWRTPTASARRPRARREILRALALAGPRLGRGARSARASAASVYRAARRRGCARPAPSTRRGRPTRRSRPSAPPPVPTSAPRWCAAGATASDDEIAGFEAEGRRPVWRFAVQVPGETVIDDYVRGAGHLRPREHRGLRRRPLRRHAHLQPRRGRRRPGRWASPTSCAARTTSPTRPSRSW